MTNSEVWMAVREGLRLHCPAGCPEEVYSVATACWRSDPSARPTFGSLRGYFSDLVHDETKSLEQPDAHNVETCSALVDAHFSSDVSNHIRRTSLFRESIKRTHHPSQFSFSSLRSQSADTIGQPSSFYGVVGASMSESYIQTLSDRGGSWDSSGTPLAELVDTPLSEIPDKYNQELTNLGLVDDVLGANDAAQFAASVSQVRVNQLFCRLHPWRLPSSPQPTLTLQLCCSMGCYRSSAQVRAARVNRKWTLPFTREYNAPSSNWAIWMLLLHHNPTTFRVQRLWMVLRERLPDRLHMCKAWTRLRNWSLASVTLCLC